MTVFPSRHIKDSDLEPSRGSRKKPSSFRTHPVLVRVNLLGLLLVLIAITPAQAQSPTSPTNPAISDSGHDSVPDFAAPERGMVTTVHPLASQAGLRAFQAGGNAIDAAIAAALTLGIVDSNNSGIGGGCFILIRLANGQFVAIDGRETAPAKATRDMYLRDDKAVPALSQEGPLAVGVPGALAAMASAVTQYGELPFQQLVLEAAQLATDGFSLDARQVAVRDQTLAYLDRVYPQTEASARDTSKVLATDQPFPSAIHFQGFRHVWLDPSGTLPSVGQIYHPTDLAATYRSIAQQGPSWFYQGEFAQSVANWMQSHGGLITRDDFAQYKPIERPPVRGTYRGYEIISFPPPSSGGVHLIQMLHILEHFDLATLGDDSSAFIHRVAEAMKLAFADRAHWLGDPDFAAVPRGLLDRGYAKELALRIRPNSCLTVTGHGTPPHADSDVFAREANRHTTHLSTVDAEGNWVAMTATVNTRFGSKVVVPGTGVVLNNQMDDFAAQPGVPNYFGLLGAEANAVEAGKRPLSSMSPTLVLKDGEPILTLGAAGGPTIISQTLLTLLRVIDFQQSPETALSRPRFHHQWQPDTLQIEPFGLAPEVLDELRLIGHTLRRIPGIGVVQAIGKIPGQPGFLGAHDPKVPGQVLGY
jgi:gamma-glutamyltranspeptidase/glutathione hydrolase